jgi:hypothetical protein
MYIHSVIIVADKPAEASPSLTKGDNPKGIMTIATSDIPGVTVRIRHTE